MTMTTKPKTRKAQAAATVSKKIETYQELKREADEIARLVIVWHFIEAEQRLLKLTKMKYLRRDERGQRMTALAQALARHKTAQAALDAVPGPEDYPEHLRDEEDEALDELAFTLRQRCGIPRKAALPICSAS